MIWVWIIILILTLLTVVVRKNSTTIGFFISSVVTLICFLIIKKFLLQLGIFVVIGILSAFLINTYSKKEKTQ